MAPIGGNAASSSFDTEQFDTPSGGGNASGQSSHTPSVTYQWEKSDNGGAVWNTLGGATSASYTTGLTTLSLIHI